MAERSAKFRTMDRKLDLDALQVFDMVMRERSVTRAADRLAITQPAVSHALTRLRTVFNDKLFLRSAGGVRPTRRAELLWSEVQEALDTLRRAIAKDTFSPGTADLGISLAVNDMIIQLLLPDWYAQLQQIAPGLQLTLITRRMGDTENRLVKGTLDFGMGVFYSLPPQIKRLALWSDVYMCVYRRGNPLAKGAWDRDTFKSLPQIAISSEGELLTYADAALQYAGIERSVKLVVSHFSCVPAILRKTNMFALLPSFYAKAMKDEYRLQMRELSIDLQPFKYELIWHERIERLRSHCWFRDELSAYCRRYFESTRGRKVQA